MTEREDRSSAALIKEYELMALSPREVFDIYKDRFDNAQEYRRDLEIDSFTDEALWSRNEPLIKLAIAMYGTNESIARQILSSGEKPLRLAMLRNFDPGRFFNEFPARLFENKEDLIPFLVNCAEEDLYEIFRNKAINREVMEEFFEQKELWQALPEIRRQQICQVFAENPIVKIPHDNRYLSGWSEYSHGKLFGKAWELTNLVPVNKDWAITLSRLTESMIPEGFPFKDDQEKLEVIRKWYPPKDGDVTKYDLEDNCHQIGFLSTYQSIRKNLSHQLLDKSIRKSHSDIAIRYGFYETEWLSGDQMNAAYEKDGIVALNAMMYNDNLWKREATRQILRDLCWTADKLDPHFQLDNANNFNAFEDRHRKDHSSWFTSDKVVEESEISDGDLPVNRRYLYEMLEVVIKSNNTTQEKIDKAEKQQKTILWIVGITLAIVALKLLT
jgi:hypothetical protein